MKRRSKNKKHLITGLILVGLLLVQFTINEGDFEKALSEKMERYKTDYPMEMVYIHTDRDVYSPEDELSFKAYVRDMYSLKPVGEGELLNMALMDNHGEIILNEAFEIKGSQVAGTIQFTKLLPEGKYFLIAFTDLMRQRNPEHVFIKELFLTTISFPSTIIHLSTSDTLYNPGDVAEINVTLLSAEGKTIRNSFDYEVRKNGASFVSGEGKTDRTGKSIIQVEIPELTDPSLITLDLTVERMRTSEKSSIIIPTTGLPYIVDFFPEGGNLINGIETKVGFIVQDYFGNPADIEGEILDPDNNVLSRFKSQLNGLGYFSYLPDINRPASLRITRPGGFNDPIYLPEVLLKGAMITLTGKSDDQLSFDMVNTLDDNGDPLHVVAEMNGEIICHQSLPFAGRAQFAIPTKDLPGGVMHVSLLTSPGELLSNRALFLNKNNATIKMETDQKQYIPEEEIKLNIAMQDIEGAKIAADLSVSVTDVNLNPDWNQDPDIFSYFTLGPGIRKSPFPPGYFSNNASVTVQNLDVMMLAVKDEKFNWSTLMGKDTGPSEQKTGQSILGVIRNTYRLDHLGMLYAQIENSQFFNRYILKYNLIFPEYYLVNQRYFSEVRETDVKRSDRNWVAEDLANGMPILEVIRKIKNYQLLDNKIVFYGPNSILNQEGALLVFNGIKMGTDVRILETLNPHDIGNIRVITNPTEVLMYTGFNPVGIIEITTKGGAGPMEDKEDKPQTYNPTLYWNPFVYTLEERETSLSFESTFMKSSYTIVVQGVDGSGNPVYEIKEISVY